MNNLFLMICTYIKPISEIEKIRPLHREYLQEGCKNKKLFLSGPHKEHKGNLGGVLIGKFDCIEDANLFTKNDPYCLNNVAIYEVIEFEALIYDDILKAYFK